MRRLRVLGQILLTIIISSFQVSSLFAVVSESVNEKYAIVTVNDERKHLKKDALLQVIWGDTIKLHPFKLHAADMRIFIEDPKESKLKPLVLQGSSAVFQTAQDLSTEEAQESAKQRRFLVRYVVGEQTIFLWHLEVLIPEFRYAVIEINGREFVLRDKLGVKVRKADKFRIKRLVTNLGEVDRTVNYEVVPEFLISGSSAGSIYSIQLSRFKRVFASFPMEVVE